MDGSSGPPFLGVVASGSESAANLARAPRCCCSADIFPSYYEIKGATAHGQAKPVEAPPEVATALAARAKAHGLADGIVYALPLLDDAFGFDFAKLARR